MSLKSVPIRLTRGWVFGWENQWAAVLRPSKFAWTDFTVIQIEVEHERAMDNWNATLGLLGFQFFVSYSYHEDSSQSENDN